MCCESVVLVGAERSEDGRRTAASDAPWMMVRLPSTWLIGKRAIMYCSLVGQQRIFNDARAISYGRTALDRSDSG